MQEPEIEDIPPSVKNIGPAVYSNLREGIRAENSAAMDFDPEKSGSYGSLVW